MKTRQLKTTNLPCRIPKEFFQGYKLKAVKIALFCVLGLVLICLSGWGLNYAQADTVSEGEKKFGCQSSYTTNEEKIYKTLSCGTDCQCVGSDLIRSLDKEGNEWRKGNDEVGGSRFRGLGGDIFWMMNGLSEESNRVLGWNSSSYAENDVYIQDNLIMYGRHLENKSDLGLIINMFSQKPVRVAAPLRANDSLVLDENDESLIYQYLSPYYNYDKKGNVSAENDMQFLQDDAYFGGKTYISGDNLGSRPNGFLFYPWVYYREDPRAAFSDAKFWKYKQDDYKNLWRKRMTPVLQGGTCYEGGFVDYSNKVVDYDDKNGFAAFLEASDYFGDCYYLEKDRRDATATNDQIDFKTLENPVGDDRVDLRLYLANGDSKLNRYSIWSYSPSVMASEKDFYKNLFNNDSQQYQQLQHAFYGDGSALHAGILDVNLQNFSKRYVDQNSLRNVTGANSLLTVWGGATDPVALHAFDNLGMAYHKLGVLFNPSGQAPDPAKEGMVYYSSASDELKYYNGTEWKSIGEGGEAGDFTNCTVIKIDPANQDGKRNIDCSNLPLNSGYVMQGICLSEAGQKQCYNPDLGMVWGFVKCCSQ